MTCEVRDSSCLNLLSNSNLYFDSSNKLQINKANVYSKDICTFCQFTDSTYKFANIIISQSFKVQVVEPESDNSELLDLINRPPEFLEIPERVEFYLDTKVNQTLEYRLPEIIDIEEDSY